VNEGVLNEETRIVHLQARGPYDAPSSLWSANEHADSATTAPPSGSQMSHAAYGPPRSAMFAFQHTLPSWKANPIEVYLGGERRRNVKVY